jgi:hypothetical protein
MNIERAKATIRQLLNLAGDGAAAQGEIDNAMRFAAKLMEQHQLRDEDLSEADDVIINLERAEMGSASQATGTTTLATWEGQAAMFVCQLVGGVKCYREHASVVRNAAGIVQMDAKGNPLVRPKITFYGVAEDVEIARQVYGELLVTIAAMARLKWGGVYRGDGREYCDGFVSGLMSQLKNDRAEAKQLASTSGGTALVAIETRGAIVERKEAMADDWIKKTFGVKLGAGRRGGGGRTHYNGNARADGRNDGAKHSPNTDRHKKLGC